MGVSTNRIVNEYRVDTDTLMTANSDIFVPTQRAVRAFIEQLQGAAPSFGDMGDSLTAGSPYFKDTTEPLEPPPVDQDIYSWPAFLRKHGITTYNYGIGGQTTSEMLARFGTVIAQKPTYCFIEGGINDVVATAKAVPFSTTQQNYRDMVALCRTNGIIPIIVRLLPTRQCTTFGESTHAAIDTIRTWQRTFATEENLLLIDWEPLFWHNGTNDILTEYYNILEDNTPDLHCNKDGYALIGRATLDWIHANIPYYKGMQPYSSKKIYFAGVGQGFTRDWAAGDILFNQHGTPGEFFALTATGDTVNPFTYSGSYIRPVAAPPVNHVGYFVNTDTSDRLWEPGDLMMIYTPANGSVEFKIVATAGGTGASYTSSGGCTTTLLFTVPVSAASWTNVAAFTNSWTNYGNDFAPARYIKDSGGTVHLQGVICGGTLSQSAFTLPVGYRPAYNTLFPSVSSSAFGSIWVYSDGRVMPTAGTTTSQSLDAISFHADQ